MIRIIILILLASGTSAFGQPSRARMIDEFRTAGNNCEEGFARLDSFFNEIANNPMDEGLIVVYGDTSDSDAAGRREKQLSNHFTFRKFDRNRVRIIRSRTADNATTQFWLVPPGADRPAIVEEERTYGPEKLQPYLYAADHADGVPGCFDNLFDLGEYASVLQADPKGTGRILISQSSKARYQRKVREILAELARNGVARNRIVTVYKYVRPNRMLELTELWIVPPKRQVSLLGDDVELPIMTHRCPQGGLAWLYKC